MKSNLLSKVFVIILSIPMLALIFGGCSGKSAEESSQTGSSKPASSATAVSILPTAVAPSAPAISEPSDPAPQVDNWEDFIGADGQPVTLDGATVDDDGRVTLDYCDTLKW